MDEEEGVVDGMMGHRCPPLEAPIWRWLLSVVCEECLSISRKLDSENEWYVFFE